MYNSPHVLAMLALQPNQAEVKNVELNDLWAGYIIPIKLKPSEIFGVRHYFLLPEFCAFKTTCHSPSHRFHSNSLLNDEIIGWKRVNHRTEIKIIFDIWNNYNGTGRSIRTPTGHVLVSKLSGCPYFNNQGNFIENICCWAFFRSGQTKLSFVDGCP